MMDAELEIKLIECLDALTQGETVEQILARYPHDAAQLRPLLQTADRLPALRREPSEAVKLRSRQKFLAQAADLRRPVKRTSRWFVPRFAAGLVAAALIAVVLSTGVVAASGSALPGDPLYGLKRTVENVQLSTAGSPAVRDELQREFDQRRRTEANDLLSVGRTGEVEFTGPIESIQPNAWIVGGLAIEINPQTHIVGTPQLNRLAEVTGLTGPNGLRASSIKIESTGEEESTPEAARTVTPQAEDRTETPEPIATATATRRPAPTSQPTEQPRPTATLEPTATAEPVELEFTGDVQTIGPDTWNIDGTVISVNADTQINGSINAGQRVKIKALRLGNGQLIATSIERVDTSTDRPRPPAPQPSLEPTQAEPTSGAPTREHGGATPEPTESHGGDHGGSTPEPTQPPNDN